MVEVQVFDAEGVSDFSEYLSKKGTIEILSEIADSPKTFSELEERINVSPATLSRRLEEGVELGVLREEIDYRDSGKAKVYTTNNPLRVIEDYILDQDLPRLFRKRREIEEELNTASSEFKSEVLGAVEDLTIEKKTVNVDDSDEDPGDS